MENRNKMKEKHASKLSLDSGCVIQLGRKNLEKSQEETKK